MNINFIYDSSVSSAPAGFITALNIVAQAAQTYFADPITVNIRVGWGEVNGQLLPSTDLGATDLTTLAAIPLTYAQLKSDLMQHATSIYDVIAINNLPASDPFGGSYYISAAQQKALGLLPPTGSEIDGAIGFSANPAIWDFNPNDGISPGTYDFVAVAEHEITHAFGRVFAPQFGVRDLLDLFDYSSPGHLAANLPGYFSIDGGKTLLNYFSISGDLADWSGILGVDANNAIATRG